MSADWTDSQIAPFVRSIIEEPEERDKTRLILADWLADRGDRHAEILRSASGYWRNHDNVVCWEAPRKNGSDSVLLTAWAWVASYPTPEWLASEDCRKLVTAWVNNGLDLRHYDWVPGIVATLPTDAKMKYIADVKRREELAEEAKKKKEEEYQLYLKLKEQYEVKETKQQRRDRESAAEEAAEVQGRIDAVRDLAMDLALALKAAQRIILSAPDSAFPSHVWNNDWPTVDRVVNRLVEIEES